MNPVEAGGQMGGIGWQRPDFLSRWAKRRVVAYLSRRVVEAAADSGRNYARQANHAPSSSSASDDDDNPDLVPPISVTLHSIDALEDDITLEPPSTPGLPPDRLTITYASPRFFLDLLIYPTPSLALLIGGTTEGRWKVSSSNQFFRLFQRATSGPRLPFQGLSTRPHFSARALVSLRLARLRWALSFLPAQDRSRRASWLAPPHFLPIKLDDYQPDGLDDAHASLWDVLLVGLACCEDLVSYVVGGRLFRVRYVPGREPWGDWARAINGLQPVSDLGSVVR